MSSKYEVELTSIEVDKKHLYQVEDKDMLKEIEENQKKEQTKKKPKLPLSQKNNYLKKAQLLNCLDRQTSLIPSNPSL